MQAIIEYQEVIPSESGCQRHSLLSTRFSATIKERGGLNSALKHVEISVIIRNSLSVLTVNAVQVYSSSSEKYSAR